MSEQNDVFRGVVAIALPDAICNQIGQLADAMARRAPGLGLRVGWVPPKAYHIGVAYLGWMRPESLQAVDDAVRQVVAAQEPFSLVLRGISPVTASPSAQLLVGFTPVPALEQLRASLVKSLLALGFTHLDACPSGVVIAQAEAGGALDPLCVMHADVAVGRIDVAGVQILNMSKKTNNYNEFRVVQRSFGVPWNVAHCQTVPVQTSKYDAALATDDGWLPGQRHGEPQ